MGDRDPATLVSQLGSPLAEVRKEAEAALHVIGDDAIAALKSGLTHGEREVRANSALLLGKLGARALVPALMIMADEDPDPSVRPMMLRAISDLVSPGANQEQKAFLIRKLQHPDMFTRALVCRALGNIGDHDAIRALELACADDERWVRDAARKALAVARASSGAIATVGREQAPPAAGPVEDTRKTAALVVRDAASAGAGLLSLDPVKQQQAQRRLEKLGQAAVPELVRHLWDDLDSTRRAALQSLGRVGGARASEAICDFLQNDEIKADLRAAALHALASAQMGSSTDAFPADLVKAHLDDPDAYVRAAAVVCLLKVGRRFRQEALSAALDDDDEWVHSATFAALAQTLGPDDSGLRSLLIEATTRVTDPVAQAQLLVGLARIVAVPPRPDDELVVGPASYFLQNESRQVRQAALLTVFKAVRQLDANLIGRIRAALDRDPETEEAVAPALVRLVKPGDEQALALLSHLLDSSSERVVDLVALSLVRIATPASIDLVIDLANSGKRHARGARDALAAIDGAAAVGAVFDPQSGIYQRELRPRCSCDAAARLVWEQRGARQELRCPECKREHVLAQNGKLYPVGGTPFGICLCCERKQVLVRGGSGQALVCPVTHELHVRPHDAPRNILRASTLPLGVCGCCSEPQPLVRFDDRVVCRRSREPHEAVANGYELVRRAETHAHNDIDAINRALLQGTLGIGQSGVPVADDE